MKNARGALAAAALIGASLGARGALSEPPVGPVEAPTTPWEAALGVNVSAGPVYQGASQTGVGASPGFYLRWQRWSITNSSGYVTRSADDVLRGLALDLARDDRWRVNLSLRLDGGRDESTSPALDGLGDVERTVRAQLAVRRRLDDGWRAEARWSIDLLGRGGGGYGSLGVAHEHRWSSSATGEWGATLTAGNHRYLQSWFGVSAVQAAASGYAVYTPAAGLRDLGLYYNLRKEFSRHWVVLGGVGVSRLLGPAAASPLTERPGGWSANLALARRF